MIIDTHCHYNLEPFFGTFESETWLPYVQTAEEHTVGAALIPGTDKESSRRALHIAAQHRALWAAIGFHPHEAHTLSQGEVAETLSQLLQEYGADKCLAIGETGLDYFQLDPANQAEREQQQRVFAEHILFANEHNLPLSIHVRDTETTAYEDVLKLLKQHKKAGLPFILHCVSGPEAYIREAVTLGGYVSCAGNATYPSAHSVRAAIAAAPPDRILVETDAPFLAPQKHRGNKCEPWMIQSTVEYLHMAQLVTPEQLLHNTITLFPQMKVV